MPPALRDLPVGYQFPPRTKRVTRERINVYCDMRNSAAWGHIQLEKQGIFTDEEYARSQGLPTVVAPGMISATWISSMMMDIFGESYLKGGSLVTTFIKLVHHGDELALHARLADKVPEGEATRLYLEVWCENQRGEKVTAGIASALLPGDRAG